ncbi:MAG TPA: mevalonate kinase [Anaerolineaceae bacterium]|nr:mevalonate kinase [Anaerolineaceae bacterium]
MPAISCSSPGKIILCGEHVVVYGYPAIALPVFAVSTRCRVFARPAATDSAVLINAPLINLNAPLSALEPQHPMRRTIELTLRELGIGTLPACEVQLTSTIPLGAGLGSSAASTVSVAHAISTFLGHPLENSSINNIAFEVEKLHHGTPSGIDNTVITYQVPIYFQRGSGFRPIHNLLDLHLVIANSGITSSTAKAVAGVRERFDAEPERYTSYFIQVERISTECKYLLETGKATEIGPLLSENHALLQRIGVSSDVLDHLVETALKAGALGAKLSGGGLGGNIIALVEPDLVEKVSQALLAAGAVSTLPFTLPPFKG